MPDRDRNSWGGVVFGPGSPDRAGMLRFSNAGRCQGASLSSGSRTAASAAALLITVLWTLAAVLWPVASAQARPGTPAAGQVQGGALPDPAEVISAYASVRRWVSAMEAPEMDSPDSQIPMKDAAAACVTLRQAGLVVGTGVDSGGDAQMVRRAAGRAMSEFRGRRAGMSGTLTAGKDTSLLGPLLILELEIAGKPSPIVGGSYPRLAEQIEPGVEGVAIRVNEKWSWLFPSQMLATNTAGSIEARILGMVRELGVPQLNWPELAKVANIGAYRFRTTHLMQESPESAPDVAMRSGSIVSQASVNVDSIRTAAKGIARHLLESMWPEPVAEPEADAGADPAPETVTPPPEREPLGIMGDYKIVADKNDPLLARPHEQAMAAFALQRLANTLANEDLMRAECAQAARRILIDLGRVGSGEDDPLANPVSGAMIVLAIFESKELQADPALQELRNAAVKLVVSSWDAKERLFVAELPPTPTTMRKTKPVPAVGQAMLACAAARLLAAEGAKVTPATVRSMIDAAWQSLAGAQHATLMPWVGWAELDWSEATGSPLDAAARLTTLRALMHASQIQDSADGTDQMDVRGGLSLTADRPVAGVPEPRSQSSRANAQSARPASFLATMLRDPRLTPPGGPEARDAVDRQLRLTRFLMQLTVRDSGKWWVRNPARALGGVMDAPWDRSQPVAAQALALLALAETVRSLEALHPVVAAE